MSIVLSIVMDGIMFFVLFLLAAVFTVLAKTGIDVIADLIKRRDYDTILYLVFFLLLLIFFGIAFV